MRGDISRDLSPNDLIAVSTKMIPSTRFSTLTARRASRRRRPEAAVQALIGMKKWSADAEELATFLFGAEETKSEEEEKAAAKEEAEKNLLNKTEKFEELKAKSKDILAKSKAQKAEQDQLRSAFFLHAACVFWKGHSLPHVV